MDKHAPAAPRSSPAARPWPALLAAGLALAGCGSVSPPLPEAPVALVYGPVVSPVMDELEKRMRTVRHTGTQKATDHDLIVLDGDAHTPQQLRSDAYLANAARAGVGVVAVDVGEAHKRSLGGVLDFATKGNSVAYFGRKVRDARGREVVRVVEHPIAVTADLPPASANPVGLLTVPLVPGPSASATAAFLTKVSAGVGPYTGLPADSTVDFPDGVIQKTYYFDVINNDVYLYKTMKGRSFTAPQQAHFDATYVLSVMLNDGNDPDGDFQYVVAEIALSGNPAVGTGKLLENRTDEKAWYQTRLAHSFAPSATDAPKFTAVASTPGTANNVTTVTSGYSITVGFTASKTPGVNAGFTYSNSRTTNIPDWKVMNNSSGPYMAWSFQSAHTPDDQELEAGRVPGDIKGGSDYPATPNNLALSEAQFDAQAIWRTNGLQGGWVDFDTYTEQALVDAWCPSDFGALCWEDNPKVQRNVYSQTKSYSVNLGAVVPVGVASVTFDKNPANAGDTLTGTVTLDTVALTDTSVDLTSNELSAVVPSNVTVPAGSSSATFQVNTTSTDNYTPGTVFVATITALTQFAQGAQGQLTLTN